MKFYSKMLVSVAVLFLTSSAFAEVYKGYYQLKDSSGSILFQRALKLTTKEVSKNKFDYIYEEVSANGLVKTTCQVEIKSRANGGKAILEKCPGSAGYSNVSECDSRLCSGISVWNAFAPGEMPVSAIDTKYDKILLINTVDPVDYLGLKGVKTYNHVLVLEKPETSK